MTDTFTAVAAHYAAAGIGDRILKALENEGIDVDALTPDVLAPIDQFHTRGLVATRDQIEMAGITPEMRVLDVGCGVGGPARWLAAKIGCRVTGIDLTPEYIEVARMLTARCGLAGKVDFECANALDLPFADASFDLAWCQNMSMNIADKRALYAEIARVIRPGGRLSATEMAMGPVGNPHFPLPWARTPEISHVASQEEIRARIEAAGFRVLEWRDTSETAVAVSGSATEKARRSMLGVPLIGGADFPERSANNARSIAEKRLTAFTMVAEKTA